MLGRFPETYMSGGICTVCNESSDSSRYAECDHRMEPPDLTNQAFSSRNTHMLTPSARRVRAAALLRQTG
jgi:hypothetical protein